MKRIFLLLTAMLSLIVCKAEKKQQTRDTKVQGKCLVLYYSQTGATKTVATEMQKLLGCDIEGIIATKPYDGDFGATIARCQQEQAQGVKTEINPLKSKIEDYDVIFLGFPVWFGTYAPPVATLVEQMKFEGKKIVPFCTFGSGGLETCANDLKKALPKAEIANGFGLRNARISKAHTEVERFLIGNGYVKGQLPTLKEFSEQKPVSEAEKAIFDKACGDYQFPLGTPASVGQRQGYDGVDYLFMVNGKDQSGKDIQTKIYVTAPSGNDAKPEFTRVVRP